MSPDGGCPSANTTCTPEVEYGALELHRRSQCLWGGGVKRHFFQTFNGSHASTSELCRGSRCLFASYGGETSPHRRRCLVWLQLANLLLFFWLLHFSLALEQCALAGAFASYYWAKRKPQDIPSCPLLLAFFRAIRSTQK